MGTLRVETMEAMNMGELSSGGAEQRPGTVNSGEEEGGVKETGTILKGWFIRKLRWGNKEN